MREKKKIVAQDNKEAMILFGNNDKFLKKVEEAFSVEITARGNEIFIKGTELEVERAETTLTNLLELGREKGSLDETDVDYQISEAEKNGLNSEIINKYLKEVLATTNRGKSIRAKTAGQYLYIEAIRNNDIVFGIGPAGTGKTYLAVVMAVQYLKENDVNRIVLVRPAVEAGESLGFLPGDMQEKIDPYLRPLYDGLNDIIGPERTERLIERKIIEIAPLAFMRGRTLDDAFIILDEAQNTTREQMKMFLTRIGFNSKAIITGDVTQVDLPKGKKSGLVNAERVLKGIQGISFHHLNETDVVRHPLVQKIIKAYEENKEDL